MKEFMPDWKRVITGDAFRVPSRDPNYYRDGFLIWPFLLFTVAALTTLLGNRYDFGLGLKFAAVSLLAILLARERFVLIAGALGFCAAQSLLSFCTRNDWGALAVAIPTGTLFLVLIRSLKDYKPSYQWPKGMSLVDLLIWFSSLALSIVLFRWIDGQGR